MGTGFFKNDNLGSSNKIKAALEKSPFNLKRLENDLGIIGAYFHFPEVEINEEELKKINSLIQQRVKNQMDAEGFTPWLPWLTSTRESTNAKNVIIGKVEIQSHNSRNTELIFNNPIKLQNALLIVLNALEQEKLLSYHRKEKFTNKILNPNSSNSVDSLKSIAAEAVQKCILEEKISIEEINNKLPQELQELFNSPISSH